MFCSTCGSRVADTARFCSRCGGAIRGDADETVLGDRTVLDTGEETLVHGQSLRPESAPHSAVRGAATRRQGTPVSSSGSSSSDPIGGGRFAPGSIVAERYRIVALLGKGGMGEVYRAEDLRLSQVLALKFLPESLSQDASALARFHSEVRVARQVSHPNVCRMFDIGDAEGLPFLTMEYVDGEDLSSLMQEKLSVKEVTTKSDPYSLGLVMYEILTGKRAYDAASLPELMKSRTDGKITNPSSLVKDLDPLVERVILRCLENDPAKRPTSVLQVAAALPGGDPLAAALAAGETPSPEMVGM